MQILSLLGALLFIFLTVFAVILNFINPKCYEEVFIPKIHEKEKKHPVITSIILAVITIVIMFGIMSFVWIS